MNHLVPLLFLSGLLTSSQLKAAPTCALAGQVVDEAGKVAAGAPVRVTVGQVHQDSTTGPQGVAELTALPCGEATIEVGQASLEWGPAWAGTTRTLRPGLPATAQLVIMARTEVTVRVADQQGHPVRSGVVKGDSAQASGSLGSPGEDGVVKAWIQPGSWSLYWVSELHEWVPGRPIHQFGGRVQAEVGQEPKIIDLVIQTREHLEGSVVDSEGEAVAGVRVFARDLEGNYVGAADSFADGRFALELSALPIVLEPVAHDRAAAFDPPRLTVQEKPTEPLLFVAGPSTRPMLRGRVVRKDTGAAVSGAKLGLGFQCRTLPEGLSYADIARVSAETSKDGTFEVRCADECPFQLYASDASGAHGSLMLPVGSCGNEVVLQLEGRPGWVLEGTVADRKGVPLEGLPLAVSHFYQPKKGDGAWMPSPNVRARTGENGRFRMEGQGSGRFRLEVDRQGTAKALRALVLVSKRAPGTPFEIELQPEDAKQVEVRVLPGATLCARAVDARNAPTKLSSITLFPVDADIAVQRTNPMAHYIGNVATYGEKEEDQQCLEGIVPGRYRVLIDERAQTIPVWYPASEDRAGAVPVVISSGMNELAPVVLRAVGALFLTIPGWPGPEPPHIEVRETPAEDAAAEIAPRLWTVLARERMEAQDGRFVVHRFPVGRWDFRACADPGCGKSEEIWSTAPVEVRRGPMADIHLGKAQATSLLGVPLFPQQFPRGGWPEQELEKARETCERTPDDPEAWIWLGRRTAFLGQYPEAVEIFSRGAARWPKDPRFLRHRGHRLLNLRRFDEAVSDLTRAAQLMKDWPDEVEPDGRPNRPNQTASQTLTLHTSVWFHLGVVRFLRAEFEPAREAFAAFLAAAATEDARVVASDWLYMALRRLGRDEEASKVLAQVRTDVPLTEGAYYLDRLLLYRGERSPQELLASDERDEFKKMSNAFGVGHWYLLQGRTAEAKAAFRRVVASAYWGQLAHVAAEAELARMAPQEGRTP
ncbi:MAG TPA: hypothetical protein VFV75_05095 [Candidatus Polarisedimenticolaceae bacterium]|nr:hypothetical protein [Candidatus Polarisedimenticolaceae bacterium]